MDYCGICIEGGVDVGKVKLICMDGRWRCYGRGIVVFGRTPNLAYKNWLSECERRLHISCSQTIMLAETTETNRACCSQNRAGARG